MEVISTRRYEARPPASAVHPRILFDPQNSIATIKEEEWETRKKKEITTTRQIKTRVKRQVVLEDGEVVKDSGPLVITNTTEDIEQQEHTTQERKTNEDEPQENQWPSKSNESRIMVHKELNETVVRSREETEELLEIEDRRQLGDITDEAYQQAIQSNRGDLRISLAESSEQLSAKPRPRVVQHMIKSNKVIDTEKTLERKELKKFGVVVTETKKSVEHEETKDVPDERNGVIETTEGERIGDWPPPPNTMRTVRLPKPTGLLSESIPMSRKDVLTKKPLDPEEEDEAKKLETSKWLENHFGSESRSSHGSIDYDVPPVQTATNTSFINVTMKSCTPRDYEYRNPSGNHRQESQNLQQQRRTSDRESGSPSEYFHGISEWSERYLESDKQNGTTRISSPKHYVIDTRISSSARQKNPRNHVEARPQKESANSRNYETATRKHHQPHQKACLPSPPAQRRVREQITIHLEEKTSNPETAASPIHVVQRTWENRSRETQDHKQPERVKIHHYSPARSRSPSPVMKIPGSTMRHDKKNSTTTKRSDQCKTRSESPREQSKSKIGESFRKLVGKLRSASSEKKNKKSGSSSTSQLTQTDDSSTYLQYNVIDRNIPEVGHDVVDEKPPERPSRSLRIASGPLTRAIKVTRSNGHSTNDQYTFKNGSATPHRYYVNEESHASSRNTYESRNGHFMHHARSSRPKNGFGLDYITEASTLGRFSKSTSRLTDDHDCEDKYPVTHTLPRKLQSSSQHSRSMQTTSNRPPPDSIHLKQLQEPNSSSRSCQSRHYNSMINISIKNAVTLPNSKNLQDSLIQSPPSPPPPQPLVKPERTYKSSLLRSKSFNAEANSNGISDHIHRIPYKSNTQLNILDETPPLKSPGILASISRSNRDLFKHEYY